MVVKAMPCRSNFFVIAVHFVISYFSVFIRWSHDGFDFINGHSRLNTINGISMDTTHER